MYTQRMKAGSNWDVIVIGGGPAGMMAAARAAERRKHVLLLEKNPKLGKKLLITGGGRCNVTNNKPIVRDMLSRYKGAGKFLFSTYAKHGVKDSIAWFKERGVELKEENEGRLFPVTNSAKTISDTLEGALKKAGVTLKTKAEVKTIVKETSGIFSVSLASGEILYGTSVIVATGGTSRPETGATGDAYPWLNKLGHTIVPNNFALVPLTLKTSWTKKLAGITLTNIKLTLLCDGKKVSAHEGKLLFTHVGVTGPTVLNLSKTVGELLAHSEVTLLLDLFPAMDAGQFKTFLRQHYASNSNKKLKNVLSELLPTALALNVLKELAIDGDTPCHSVSTEDRKNLALTLKALPLPIKGLLGSDKAVVSSGGVALEDIDFKTMMSRKVPHLYIVGDLLNVDRPSGGYSLQLCWSTGFVAGDSV